MSALQKELRRPGIQQRVFSYAKASPTELVRSKLSTSEIQHRALTYLPDELLADIPEDENAYSLFQGFQATLPESENEHRKRHKRRNSRGQKLLEADDAEGKTPLEKLKKERHGLNHRLEMMGVRKNMCSAEIREIDNKISNLNTMRKIVLDRLGDLEQDEVQTEQDLLEVDNKLEDLLEELDDAATLGHTTATPPTEIDIETEATTADTPDMSASFMSASIYGKLPSPKAKRNKPTRRKSMPIRHEHFEPGSSIKELQAHNDMITALDFDAPFGTMITSALDDTVRVWDLNLGRCIGFLEGHHASVRCLQVEDNLVATGSMDASIRLWDLSKAEYSPREDTTLEEEDEDQVVFDNINPPASPHPSSMQDCPLFTLEAHVDEVTALHFRGDTLVSGSSDKTLRQWDLAKGRCVQTLDVLWAAAQASSTMNTTDAKWRATGRAPDASADFVGALQCFDAALACGTADGMVRLWDLRSGQVHRSLVGHTGPVTCLQFDDVHLVTGSLDRSIRVSLLPTVCALSSPSPPSSLSVPFPDRAANLFEQVYVAKMTSSDLGPPNRLHPRRLRLRQPGLEHDVRRPPDRVRRGRERGQGLRQDGRPALGLRRSKWEEWRGEGEGQGRVFDRGKEEWGGGHLDLLSGFGAIYLSVYILHSGKLLSFCSNGQLLRWDVGKVFVLRFSRSFFLLLMLIRMPMRLCVHSVYVLIINRARFSAAHTCHRNHLASKQPSPANHL